MYPEIEPHASGMLEAASGNHVYWETCGNPAGKPALMVHGGPGSGCSPAFRRFFDPARYRVVLFDQRNCGRSRPHASDPSTGLALFGVTTGRHSEVDWAFRGGLSRFFPEQWSRLAGFAGETDVVEAIARMLSDPDGRVRRKAAEEWCLWESAPAAELAPRFRDPDYAVAFARIVTHYMRHNLFLDDGVLLREAGVLSSIDGVLINAREDLQAPVDNALELARAWPRARLAIVDEAGHGTGPAVSREIVQATDAFARQYM